MIYNLFYNILMQNCITVLLFIELIKLLRVYVHNSSDRTEAFKKKPTVVKHYGIWVA